MWRNPFIHTEKIPERVLSLQTIEPVIFRWFGISAEISHEAVIYIACMLWGVATIPGLLLGRDAALSPPKGSPGFSACVPVNSSSLSCISQKISGKIVKLELLLT